MPVHEWNAADFIANHRTWIRFADDGLTKLLHKGRVSAGDLLYLGGCRLKTESKLRSMEHDINTDKVVFIEYSSTCSVSEDPEHVCVNSLQDLVSFVETLACADPKPRAVILLELEDVLKGYRICKLERLILELLSSQVAVITNWSVLASLSTQRIVLR